VLRLPRKARPSTAVRTTIRANRRHSASDEVELELGIVESPDVLGLERCDGNDEKPDRDGPSSVDAPAKVGRNAGRQYAEDLHRVGSRKRDHGRRPDDHQAPAARNRDVREKTVEGEM